MVDILQMTFLMPFLRRKPLYFDFSSSWKFVPKHLIDNKSSLLQVMACCQTGNKPIPEPMMTQFNDITCVARPQSVNMHT